MLKSLFLIFTVLLTAPSISAQEVPDQSSWSSGSSTVTVDVDTNPQDQTTVLVNVTDDSGSSTFVVGSPGDNSNSTNLTTDESGEMSTPGGTKYRVKDGKLQKKTRRGKWVDMRKKKPKGNRSAGGSYSGPGPWKPVGTGEEVVSLPMTGGRGPKVR